jgi:hypothetical protein
MAIAGGMPAPDQHSLIKKKFFMKQLFIALCIVTATSVFTLVACSKKDGLVKKETAAASVQPIPAAKSDTPYGKRIHPVHIANPSGDKQPGIIFIPAAKSDTPYGK